MDEKKIIEWLEERAADSGIKDCRITIENREPYPIATYASHGNGPLRCGLGKTLDEAFKCLYQKIAADKKKYANSP